MANEISLLISASVANGNFTDTFKPPSVKIDQSTDGRGGNTQTIGTSEEVIDFGGIVSEGMIFLRNLDDTNFVTYGPESAAAMVGGCKIKPGGEPAAFRLTPGSVWRAQADTAPVKLDVTVWED